jgi:hypothetical protein
MMNQPPPNRNAKNAEAIRVRRAKQQALIQRYAALAEKSIVSALDVAYTTSRESNKSDGWLSKAKAIYDAKGYVFVQDLLTKAELDHLMTCIAGKFDLAAAANSQHLRTIVGGIKSLTSTHRDMGVYVKDILDKVATSFKEVLHVISPDLVMKDSLYMMKKDARCTEVQLIHADTMYPSMRALLYIDPEGSSPTLAGSMSWLQGSPTALVTDAQNRPIIPDVDLLETRFSCLLSPQTYQPLLVAGGATLAQEVRASTSRAQPATLSHLVPGGTMLFFRGDFPHAGGPNPVPRDRYTIFYESHMPNVRFQSDVQLHPPGLAEVILQSRYPQHDGDRTLPLFLNTMWKSLLVYKSKKQPLESLLQLNAAERAALKELCALKSATNRAA